MCCDSNAYRTNARWNERFVHFRMTVNSRQTVSRWRGKKKRNCSARRKIVTFSHSHSRHFPIQSHHFVWIVAMLSFIIFFLDFLLILYQGKKKSALRSSIFDCRRIRDSNYSHPIDFSSFLVYRRQFRFVRLTTSSTSGVYDIFLVWNCVCICRSDDVHQPTLIVNQNRGRIEYRRTKKSR